VDTVVPVAVAHAGAPGRSRPASVSTTHPLKRSPLSRRPRPRCTSTPSPPTPPTSTANASSLLPTRGSRSNSSTQRATSPCSRSPTPSPRISRLSPRSQPSRPRPTRAIRRMAALSCSEACRCEVSRWLQLPPRVRCGVGLFRRLPASGPSTAPAPRPCRRRARGTRSKT
jgi:hypothetical protein